MEWYRCMMTAEFYFLCEWWYIIEWTVTSAVLYALSASQLAYSLTRGGRFLEERLTFTMMKANVEEQKERKRRIEVRIVERRTKSNQKTETATSSLVPSSTITIIIIIIQLLYLTSLLCQANLFSCIFQLFNRTFCHSFLINFHRSPTAN